MTEEARLVPKRRFKEFEGTEGWKCRKFFDNIKNVIDFRGRTPKKLGLYWSDSGYLALSALNVKNGYIDPNADANYGNQELYDKWMKGNELKKGQVLFTTEAPMGNVAQVPDNKGYILSQRTIAFDVNEEKVADDFLAVLLRSPKTFADLSALSSGGTAQGVSQKSMSQLEVAVPLNLEEQIKIGFFFKNLNNLITLHQRKLEKTKALKSAYLSEMFPTEGEKKPKRRFAGFTDDWEQCKLGEMTEGFEYGLNASATVFDGINKYIRITDIDDDSRLFNQNGLTSPDFDSSKSDNYLLKNGDILFARTGASVGKTYRYKESDGKVYYAGFLIRARINQNFDAEFVFQNTLTAKYDDYIKITSQRSGQPGVNAQEYANFELMVPKLEEQKAIGIFLKGFDNIITLYQGKLEKLQKLKKAYLNEMFV